MTLFLVEFQCPDPSLNFDQLSFSRKKWNWVHGSELDIASVNFTSQIKNVQTREKNIHYSCKSEAIFKWLVSKDSLGQGLCAHVGVSDLRSTLGALGTGEPQFISKSKFLKCYNSVFLPSIPISCIFMHSLRPHLQFCGSKSSERWLWIVSIQSIRKT